MTKGLPNVSIFKIYLQELRSVPLNEKTEHTDRSYLQKILKEISINIKNIKVISEPKRDTRGLGSPDFKIKADEAILGYVEVKNIGEDITTLISSEQINKYRQLNSNILLTNYIDFIWFKGEHQQHSSLGKVSKLFSSSNFTIEDQDALNVQNLLDNFFSTPPQGITTAKELAKALAPRSRILRDFFVKVLVHQEVLKEDSLYKLYIEFKERVFRELRIDEFANVFAQLISYGLFLARLQTDGNIKLSVDNAKKYIPKSFELIKQMVRFLDELDTSDYEEIKWVVDEIFSIINTFDFKAIHHDLEFDKLSSTQVDLKPIKDPYVYFYEDFLQEYDNELRRNMGVYYTPLPIVKFIINSVEDILRETFKIEGGFSNRKVTALDFATGTGTFLVEIFKHILLTLPADSGKRDFIIQNHLLKNFYGFEYMIAPYAIAHLKLSEFLKEKGYELKEHERLGIYLTNTLEPVENSSSQPSLLSFEALTRESDEAREIKKKTILVIVGNPPYNGTSRHHTPGLIDAYKWVDGNPLNEKKNWLNDDYVKFIRFAQNKMAQVEEGVVGIITNHGFLDNSTFRGMRQSLMDTFQQIYILNLHGNVKKRDKISKKLRDENIFEVQQGVCITFFIKKPRIKQGIYYTDLWGTKEEKFNFCDGESFHSIKWQQVHPITPNYFFIPFDNKEGEKYNGYWSLKEIFTKSNVGIVTARDSLTIDFNEEVLMKRVREFSSLPIEIARTKYNLGKDSQDWKISYAQKSLIETNLSSKYIQDINYRPFDIRKIYYTTRSKGFIGRPLHNIMHHMLMYENIGLTFVRQIKAGEWQHSFVTKNLMESAYISNKTSELNYIAPLYCNVDSSYSEALLFGSNRIENFSSRFRQSIDM